MDAKEIARRLADRCDKVCMELLPEGAKDGREWVFDPGHGKIKVMLSGAKIGIWAHFGVEDAANARGDLLDLWAYVRDCSIGDALKAAAEFLGIEKPQFHGQQRKEYRRPAPDQTTSKPATPGTEVDQYLRGERGLTKETIKRFKIREGIHYVSAEGKKSPGPWIMFPYFRPGPDGIYLANIKWLHVKRKLKNGKRHKITFQERDAEPCLFGWHLIPDDARWVAIVEGESDTMTFNQWGIHALGTPIGAGAGGKHQWIETDFDLLARFDVIYLCMDPDAEGETATRDIAGRLGLDRCPIVKLPYDANECLVPHAMTQQDVWKFFEDAKYMEPEELRNASTFVDQVIDRFYPSDHGAIGIELPWASAKDLRLRYGEVTLLSGVNFSGKSELVGQITLAACDQGERALIASLEMQAAETLKRQVQQIARTKKPSEEYIRACHNWFDDKLWIYDRIGRADRARLLDVMTYARRRYGIRLHCIDSLMRCGIDEDDYKGQGDFVDALIDWTREEECHVILVVHPTKPKDEKIPGGRFQMKGTGKITDLAHVTLNLWRNVPKEERIEKIGQDQKLSESDRANKLADKMAEPDSYLKCDKQRTGTSWTGNIRLWYSAESRSWSDRDGTEPDRMSTTPVERELAF